MRSKEEKEGEREPTRMNEVRRKGVIREGIIREVKIEGGSGCVITERKTGGKRKTGKQEER